MSVLFVYHTSIGIIARIHAWLSTFKDRVAVSSTIKPHPNVPQVVFYRHACTSLVV